MISEKQQLVLKLVFSIITIILGVILSITLGFNESYPFNGVGSFLIFVGILSLALTFLRIKTKKKLVDERMHFIGYKTNRILTSILFLSLFIVMIYDMIFPIKIQYYLGISYFVCFWVLTYFIVYKIVEKYN
jgi:hypothetical protein